MANRLVLFGMAAALAGCASTPDGGADGGKYPPWLIRAAEPVAPAVGFAISHTQWRRGYLKGREDALRQVQAHLQPLDILLFSSKGRLSGHTGSGLFGHSAIYLGSERELKAMGLLSGPEMKPLLGDLSKGRLIVESAQKHGTDLSSLDYVADTDRIVIVRPKGISPDARRTAIRTALSRVGGEFDHWFRMDETGRLFCTELIDVALPQLSLPRHETYGRQVVLPDDLALMAVRGERLAFVFGVEGGKDGWHASGPSEVKADIMVAGG